MLMSGLIGHRGARQLAPENTCSGISAAIEHHVQWIEADVMLTSDKVPIIFHDHQLQRVTRQKGITDQQTWAKLQTIQVQPPHGSRWPADTIPSLVQWLNTARTLGVGLNLEIKPSQPQYANLTARLMLEVLKDFPDLPIVISSFNGAALATCLNLAPTYPRARLWDQLPSNWADDARRLGVSAINLNNFKLRRHQVEQLKAQGLECYVYTVNRRSRAQKLHQWGVSGIFTDRPDLMQDTAFNHRSHIRRALDADPSSLV